MERADWCVSLGIMGPSIRIALCLAALFPAHFAFADDNDIRVDVITEVTPAGKKIDRPTPECPAYYILVLSDYQPGGQLAFWQRPPPSLGAVVRILKGELSRQCYLAATPAHPPLLLLKFSWGYAAPVLTTGAFAFGVGGDVPRPALVSLCAMQNAGDMLELTGGIQARRTWQETSDPWRVNLPEGLSEAAGFPRYYATLEAFEYPALPHLAGRPLWTTHISVPYWGHYMDEAIPALLATGAPMFGRDSDGPHIATEALVPIGRVIVGTPVLKTDAPESATPKMMP
jgi:hypothetical protein